VVQTPEITDAAAAQGAVVLRPAPGPLHPLLLQRTRQRKYQSARRSMYKVDKESTNKKNMLEKCDTTNPDTAAQGAVIYRPAPGPLHPLQLQPLFGVFRPHLSNLFSEEMCFTGRVCTMLMLCHCTTTDPSNHRLVKCWMGRRQRR
jgi:hypothetical protein